jgi:gamma-glutamylcyclotransferase (GGCT)/AIG2-like uncharacterized protein YtfP
MGDLIFFYGTLMSAFQPEVLARLDGQLQSTGRGSIAATLFDLGSYPAAIPALDGRVRGELYRMRDVGRVLFVLDEFEGYSSSDRFTSLYVRDEAAVRLDDGQVVTAWVYFYNAPLVGAPRIDSGDYREYMEGKSTGGH